MIPTFLFQRSCVCSFLIEYIGKSSHLSFPNGYYNSHSSLLINSLCLFLIENTYSKSFLRCKISDKRMRSFFVRKPAITVPILGLFLRRRFFSPILEGLKGFSENFMDETFFSFVVGMGLIFSSWAEGIFFLMKISSLFLFFILFLLS